MRTAQEAGRDAVWAAVLEHEDRVRRVARSRCRTPQDAEDCAQEAMARVAAMPDVDLDRIGPLLSTVVANLAVDGHRAAGRAARAEPKIAVLPGPTPEDALCDAAEARWLWASRHRLPDRERQVLELRAQGRTVAETAAALGVTYKAAESAYTRARTGLRAIWRTTAALLAVLWGRPARQTAGGAAVAVAATAVLLGAAPPPAEGEPPPASPSDARPAAPGPALQQGGPAAPPSAPTERPTPSGPPVPQADDGTKPSTPPAPDRAEPPDLVVPPLRVGPAGAEGTTAGRERTDETFTETVARCAEHGVDLSPFRVGCRTEGQGTGTQYFPPG